MQLMFEKINWIIVFENVFANKGNFQKMSRNSYFSCPVEGQVCSFLPNRWVWSYDDLTKFRCLSERAETGRFSSLPPWCHVQRKYQENGSKTMLAPHSVEIQGFFLTLRFYVKLLESILIRRALWSQIGVAWKVDFTVSRM